MTRAETWLAVALTAVVVAPVWLVDHPPLQDYPYHLVRAHVLLHHGDPGLGYRETFTVSWYPAPYALADWLVAGFGRLAGIPLAGKLVLSLYLGLFPWSFLYLTRGVGEGRSALGFLGFLLVLNWHFHMGFVSYALSLPAALFALGWWWRRRRALAGTGAGAWNGVAPLALLALATYLFHVYAFGVLAFVLVVLALAEGRREGAALRLLARTLAALSPALALLAGAVLRVVGRSGAGSGGGEGPLLLLYGGFQRKVLLALGSLPSFSVAWETALFALGIVVALAAAAAAWRRGRRPEPSLLVAAAALAVLYVLLPDHLGRVFFVANRVPLFLLLVGLAALPAPASPALRRLAVLACAALALAHAAVLAHRYLEIDRRLGDYEAALAALPAGARVAFLADRQAMAHGRIAPAALFGGYHYLRAPGSRIPDLEHFVGTLRVVDYRDHQGRSLSTATVGSRRELAELLGRPWLVGQGGLVVRVGEDPGARVDRAARRYGFERLLDAGPVRVHRKARPVFLEDPEERYYATGYALDEAEYAVVYDDPARGGPAVGEGWEPVRSAGWATVLGRAESP